MSHTANSQTASYVWDVNRGLPQVLMDGTNKGACPEPSRRVYGLDLISATDGAGNTTYFTTDGLGSTTDITNSSGVRTDGYTYDVFGAATHSPGASANPWQFTGEQTDADSGLQYLRARYYDPATGRFLSQDPIGAAEPYAYVSNNPANLADPLGLCGFGGIGDAWDCVEDGADTVTNVADCVSSPATCAIDQFIGSKFDKELVGQAGAAAKGLANSGSQRVDKEGGINLIQNCGSAFCKSLFTATQTPNCVTIGNTILCKSDCEVGTSCFRHESTHVRQYRDLGLLGFYQKYSGSDPKNALKCLASGEFKGLFGCVYRSRPLEEEAFGNE